MSRKLATIIKDSKIPGKWKRILEAYAAFANNDGTNIYPAKEKLGKKAGASPDTVYRNTPDLLACGILRIAESHTCRVPNCNKGATHFTGKWGHYTTVYNLHIGNLQNAETYLSAKYQEVCAAKCRKVGSANCGTTQAIKETPATLGTKQDSSVTHVTESVSQLVRHSGAVAPSDDGETPTSKPQAVHVGKQEEPKPTPTPTPTPEEPAAQTLATRQERGFKEVLDELGENQAIPLWLGLEYFAWEHEPLLNRITLVLVQRNRSVSWLTDLVKWIKQPDKNKQTRESRFWQTRVHVGDRALAQLAKHLETRELPAQFDAYLVATHGESYLRRGFSPRNREHPSAYLLMHHNKDERHTMGIGHDGKMVGYDEPENYIQQPTVGYMGETLMPPAPKFSDLCPECAWELHRCVCGAKAKAVGAGFEHEEAE